MATMRRNGLKKEQPLQMFMECLYKHVVAVAFVVSEKFVILSCKENENLIRLRIFRFSFHRWLSLNENDRSQWNEGRVAERETRSEIEI